MVLMLCAKKSYIYIYIFFFFIPLLRNIPVVVSTVSQLKIVPCCFGNFVNELLFKIVSEISSFVQSSLLRKAEFQSAEIFTTCKLPSEDKLPLLKLIRASIQILPHGMYTMEGTRCVTNMKINKEYFQYCFSFNKRI